MQTEQHDRSEWTTVGTVQNLDINVYQDSTLLKSSNLANSSTEMVYFPLTDGNNYRLKIEKKTKSTEEVRYAYAWSTMADQICPKGDLDLDMNVTYNDATMLLNYVNDTIELNNLQTYLADYDGNGMIDKEDFLPMIADAYKNIEMNDNATMSMTKKDLFNLRKELECLGDGNVVYDTELNYYDIKKAEQIVYGQAKMELAMLSADVDYDGMITENDLAIIRGWVCYKDIDGDGQYSEDDICIVHDALIKVSDLNDDEIEKADLNCNGKIDSEDIYMLSYGYYLNVDKNPDLGREQFYGNIFTYLNLELGNLDNMEGFTDNDLKLFKNTIDGNPWSYRCLFLADVNMDLKLDEKDVEIYETEYMSDILFTYTLDATDKTMCITGVKNKNIQFAQIGSTYCVNMVQYTVTEIGKNAFFECENLDAVYIPKTVITIDAEEQSESPFYDLGNYINIYCESTSKPESYGKWWHGSCGYCFEYEIKEADDYYYYETDDENKTLTITGIKGEWWYNDEEVIIEDQYWVNGELYKVVKIADEAFYEVDCIEYLEFPATIEEVGNRAAADIYKMESIVLNRCHRLKKIGQNAFAWNGGLEQLWIPASVEIIIAEQPEESIVWKCNIENIWILADVKEDKEGWGQYWNYVNETQEAETTYIGR